MTASADEPAVTRSGDVPLTLTVGEAAAVLGVGRERVTELARRGRVEAVKVDRMWLVDGPSLQQALQQATPATWEPRRLHAGLLLRQIALAGGDAAVGVVQGSAEEKALERARRDGTVTPCAADHLAVKLLGLTLWDLWDC